MGFLLVFGTSIFVASSQISTFLGTTLQIDTESTFRRLVALNPLMVKTVSSLEEIVSKVKETAATATEEGKQESVTTDKILSLLGISSFSPISNIASAFSGLSSGENNFIVGEGLTWTVRSGSRARESLSLGSGDTPTFGGLKIDTDQVFQKDGDTLQLLSIDSLDSKTETTIENALDNLPSIATIGTVTENTLEGQVPLKLDTQSG